MVIFTVVHIAAHMHNFYELALADPNATTFGQRVVVFLEANFTTGPGATGWIMTVILGIMVWFAMEKRRRANFERFWYTHHLFVVFFLAWQLHGVWCMIKPDREPFCSSNSIGVFWVRELCVRILSDIGQRLFSSSYSDTGLLVASFGRTNGFYAKFAHATRPTFPRSSSTHPKLSNSRLKKRRQLLGQGNTFLSLAQRFPTFSGTLLRLRGKPAP